MTFDIVTIFPAMIEQAVAAGIVGRAIERGTLDVKVRDLRDFTTDRHRVVDDTPYGGGPGMVRNRSFGRWTPSRPNVDGRLPSSSPRRRGRGSRRPRRSV
jgi:hypothetical protein